MAVSVGDLNVRLTSVEILVQMLYIETFRDVPAEKRNEPLENWRDVATQTIVSRFRKSESQQEKESLEQIQNNLNRIFDDLAKKLGELP